MLVDVACRNTVFHHEPQQASARLPELLAHGVRRCRVEFVREDRRTCAQVLAAWRELLAGRIDRDELGARTGATARIGVAQGSMRLLGDGGPAGPVSGAGRRRRP